MNPILYLTHPLNGLIMIALPIVIGIIIARKFNLGWRLWWIGAATFVLSQVGHIPFNAAVGLLMQRGILPTPSPANELLFSAVFLGLSAGFWEEGLRYAVYRWWAKDARSWSKALMLGDGHGGIEAILLGSLVLVNFIILVSLRTDSLSHLLPADQLAAISQQSSAYWSVAWYDSMLGALERAFAIPLQISLSVLMLQCFVRKQIRWFFIAVVWHALVDAVAVYMIRTQGAYLTEGVVGIMGLISIVVIFALRQPEPTAEDGLPPLPDVQRPDIGAIEPTQEKLDESRYQ
jgi:uncharacterized membrane protein YhfC